MEMDQNKESDALLESKSSNILNSVKGIVGTFLYVLLAEGSRISVQSLDGAVPDFELNSFRCGCAAIGMMLYFMVTRSFPWIKRENWVPLILLVFMSNVLTIITYVAVAIMPLATAGCVTATFFLLGGILIFTTVNKERLRWDVLLSVPMCIVGVTLVIQPEFIFHKQIGKENSTEIGVGTVIYKYSTTQYIGLILSAFAGISSAIEISIIKYYGPFFTVNNLISSLVYCFLAGTLMSLVPMFIFENPTFPTDPKNLFYLSFHCLTYLFTLLVMFYSSKFISGNLGSIIRSTSLVVSLIAQYTFLKHIYPGHRNWIEIFGAVLVLMGTIASSVVEIIRESKGQKF